MLLEIKTADELIDAELEGRWAARRAARQTDVLREILRVFADRGSPVPVDAISAGLSDRPPAAVREALITLDEEDLIRVQEGLVEIAYPFSAAPTSFVVRLGEGQERYACCAIDALGMAPMLGQRVEIRSRCHDCGDVLELAVSPAGPAPEAGGVMVWVGRREAGQRRIATSL